MSNEDDADKRIAALMEEVVNDLGSVEENDGGGPYRAMVRIWCTLRGNMPLLNRATKAAGHDPKTVEKVREKVAEILLSRGTAIRQQLEDTDKAHPGHVCAFLQGIEDYLEDGWYGQITWTAPLPSVRFDGRRYQAFRRPHERATFAPLAQQKGKLEHWFKRHWIAPAEINGIQIHRMPNRHIWDENLDLDLDRIREGGDFKVFVASFIDGVRPKWTDEAFGATGLTDENERWESVEAALEKAVQEKVRILVFPELTLPDTLRIRLCRWLAEECPDHPFLLVLAGSFHIKKDDEVYNEAQLLDRYGSTALSHTKLAPYEKGDRAENIKSKYHINVLDTPLGSFVIPICKDFCDSDVQDLWNYVRADWFLVPAFGEASSIDAHENRARELWIRSNSFCLIANQHPEGIPESNMHGFIAAGAFEDCKFVCPDDKNSKIAYACETMLLTSDFPAHED